MPIKRDFFISYTKADERWANWIAWVLDQNRYSFVIQALDFVPGQDFISQMRAAIRNTYQTIAVLSPQYFKSRFANAELNSALAADPLGTKGRLVPIKIRPCRSPDMLASRIHIDLVAKDSDTARRDLLSGIAAARLGKWEQVHEARFATPPKFPGVGAAAQRRIGGPSDNSRPIRILFLGVDAGRGLDLAGQADGLEAIIRESPHAADFVFLKELNVKTDNIFKHLSNHKPHIVHVSGNQNGGNVLIRTPRGAVTTVSDMAFAGLLQSIGDSARLVIMDTCKSLRCAAAVTDTVDLAIGVAADVYEDDAKLFYDVFYKQIAHGKSADVAVKAAQRELRSARVEESEIPQLLMRRGINAQRYTFVP